MNDHSSTISQKEMAPFPRGDPLSPFLKWAGGKGQLVKELVRFVPGTFRRYLEPFVGGGALFFDLRPRVSLLNDLNDDLIITYRVVQQKVEALIRTLRNYPFSKEFYYRLRALDVAKLSPVARAARLIYLNRTCYNGLYRVNKQNQFNVPFGAYRSPTICDSEKLRSASLALQGARLFCEDYRIFLDREAKPGDFIYIDPPYDPVSRYSDFKRYTSFFFYKQNQKDLAILAKELVERGCCVLASNSNTPFIRRLYRGAEIIKVRARRNISRKGEGRGQVEELLIVWRPKSFN